LPCGRRRIRSAVTGRSVQLRIVTGAGLADPAVAGPDGAGKYYGKFYASGPASKNQFALTYDDGPGYITLDLLELLKKYGATASFFMTGSSVRASQAKTAKVAAGGHLIGNHTDLHKNYFKIGGAPDREKALEKELDKAAESIVKAGGKRPEFLRMPNGYDRDWVRKVAARKGYVLVNWGYGSDWTRVPEDKMTAEYLKNLKPGAILLLHDGGDEARRVVGELVDAQRVAFAVHATSFRMGCLILAVDAGGRRQRITRRDAWLRPSRTPARSPSRPIGAAPDPRARRDACR